MHPRLVVSALALALATSACGSSPAPAPATPVVANGAPAAAPEPERDPREARCFEELQRFGLVVAPETVAACVAGFADHEDLAACTTPEMRAEYESCYPGCLYSVSIDPESGTPDEMWLDAVSNCVAGCSSVSCPDPA
jgi:hypothetical protein